MQADWQQFWASGCTSWTLLLVLQRHPKGLSPWWRGATCFWQHQKTTRGMTTACICDIVPLFVNSDLSPWNIHNVLYSLNILFQVIHTYIIIYIYIIHYSFAHISTCTCSQMMGPIPKRSLHILTWAIKTCSIRPSGFQPKQNHWVLFIALPTQEKIK